MPFLSRTFSERDPLGLSVVGIAAVACLGVLVFGAAPAIRMLTSASYTAELASAGNLRPGDEVKLNGVQVGKVDSIELVGEHVAVDFTAHRNGRLGSQTRAAVRTATVLGTKFLALDPEGPGQLPSGSTIPLDRTDSGYDLQAALSTLTADSQQLDKRRLATALDTMSAEFAQSATPLHTALDGVGRLSVTLGSRDQAIGELLRRAQVVTGVLAGRSDDVITLATQGNQLLRELNGRRDDVHALLVNVRAAVDQLNGLAKDNEEQLKPTLDQLHSTLALLDRNDKNLAALIHGLNTYAGSLGEAVAGGPWFFAYLHLPPTGLIPGLPLGSGNTPGLPLTGPPAINTGPVSGSSPSHAGGAR